MLFRSVSRLRRLHARGKAAPAMSGGRRRSLPASATVRPCVILFQFRLRKPKVNLTGQFLKKHFFGFKLPGTKSMEPFYPWPVGGNHFRHVKTGHPLRFTGICGSSTARHPSSRLPSFKPKRTGLFYRNAFCGSVFTGNCWNVNISAIQGWDRLL